MFRVKKYFFNTALYLAAALAITAPWFLKSGYLFFTDFVWGPNLPVHWQSNWFLLHAIARAAGIVLPLDLVQKIILTLIFAFIAGGAARIALNFVPNKILAFVVGLFGLFNPYIYDRVMYGQIGVILALGCLLWTAAFLIEFLDKKKLLLLILAGATTGLVVQFSAHFVFFVGLLWLAFLPTWWLRRREFNRLAIVKALALGIAAAVILNANWLYANISGSSSVGIFVEESIGVQDLTAFQTAGNTSGKAMANVFMMSGFWGKDQFRYIDLTTIKENWGKSFYIVFPLMILGAFSLYKGKRTRILAVSLLIALVIAFILAVGIRIFGAKEITLWLFNHFPFYKALRETQKWVAVIVVIYTIFISVGLRELFKKKFVYANRWIANFFVAGAIVMQAPLLLFGLHSQVLPSQYPNGWHEVNHITADEEKCAGKILFLPWHRYMAFSFIGGVVETPAKVFFKCPVIQGSNMEFGGIFDNSGDETSRQVYNWIISRGKTDLISKSDINIGYIVLTKEVDWLNYLWLNGLSGFRFIGEYGDLLLYKFSTE